MEENKDSRNMPIRIYDQLIFEKSTEGVQWRKNNLFNNDTQVFRNAKRPPQFSIHILYYMQKLIPSGA